MVNPGMMGAFCRSWASASLAVCAGVGVSTVANGFWLIPVEESLRFKMPWRGGSMVVVVVEEIALITRDRAAPCSVAN